MFFLWSPLFSKCWLCIPAYCLSLLGGRGLNLIPWTQLTLKSLPLASEFQRRGFWMDQRGPWASEGPEKDKLPKGLQTIYCYLRKRQYLGEWRLSRQALDCLVHHFLSESNSTLPSKLKSWRRSTPQQPCSSPYSSYGHVCSNGLSASCMHKFSSSLANRALKNWN